MGHILGYKGYINVNQWYFKDKMQGFNFYEDHLFIGIILVVIYSAEVDGKH